MTALARIWTDWRFSEPVPDADRLIAWAEERIAVFEAEQRHHHAMPLTWLGMSYVEGEYSNGDRLLWLGETIDRLRQAIAEEERALVRYACGLCDMPLTNAAAVCLRCCGAEPPLHAPLGRNA